MKKIIYIAISIAFFSLGTYVGSIMPNEKEIEIVEIVKERVRVVTVTKEHPDGTTETTIIEETIKERQSSNTTKSRSKNWNVGATMSILEKPIYGLRVERYLLWGLYGGLYGRTDGELGLSLSYSF